MTTTTTTPVAATGVRLAPPPSALGSLARLEIRRYARHPLFLVGVADASKVRLVIVIASMELLRCSVRGGSWRIGGRGHQNLREAHHERTRPIVH